MKATLTSASLSLLFFVFQSSLLRFATSGRNLIVRECQLHQRNHRRRAQEAHQERHLLGLAPSRRHRLVLVVRLEPRPVRAAHLLARSHRLLRRPKRLVTLQLHLELVRSLHPRPNPRVRCVTATVATACRRASLH